MDKSNTNTTQDQGSEVVDQATPQLNPLAKRIREKNSKVIGAAMDRGWFVKFMEKDSCVNAWKYNSSKEKEEQGVGSRNVFSITENEIHHQGQSIKLDLFDGDPADLLDSATFTTLASEQTAMIAAAIKAAQKKAKV